MRALAADEPRNRRLLEGLRQGEQYRLPWIEEQPLVSVTVATLGRPELISRSLPSILAQTHENLEVIVAGDGAPAETAVAVAELADPRVRYLDLGPRQSWTDDPARLWLVGATRPRNAALATATGRWIVEFDDDDALRSNCVEALLELAGRPSQRPSTARSASTRAATRPTSAPSPLASATSLGRPGCTTAACASSGARRWPPTSACPGDWWLAERMLRAGVRFAMRDEVLCDAYASDRGRIAREHGRTPWVRSGPVTRPSPNFAAN